MQVKAMGGTVGEHLDKAVVVGVWQDEPLVGSAAAVDELSSGALSRLLEREEIGNKVGDATCLLGAKAFEAPVVVAGCGKRDDLDAGAAFRAAGSATKLLAAKQRSKVACFLDLHPVPAAVCGAMVGCQGQAQLKAEPQLHPIDQLLWMTDQEEAVKEGIILGECINSTRRLVNLPANEMYPVALAQECERGCAELDVQVEVWDETRLESERCRALLGVGQGSSRESRLVIMRYRGGADEAPTLGLVGKGVTFDSGGLSLKPGASMIDMRMDMAGAATVLGGIQAIARLAIPVNVVGVVGLVENMVSNQCLRPGDVITARGGKTVEVRNTDAEGRLVLADAVDVAIEQGANRLIDVATLTGSCMAALGLNTVGLMSNDDSWVERVQAAAQVAGEQTWRLPMFDEFADQIKSEVADIKNVGEGRWGGAMTAAKFIEAFVQDRPWVHMDIAGPAFSEKPKAWIDAGATGCMVRTLVEIARGSVAPE